MILYKMYTAHKVKANYCLEVHLLKPTQYKNLCLEVIIQGFNMVDWMMY